MSQFTLGILRKNSCYLHTKQLPLLLHVSSFTHLNQPLTINNIAALTRAWHKRYLKRVIPGRPSVRADSLLFILLPAIFFELPMTRTFFDLPCRGTEADLPDFFSYLNTLHPTIKFTFCYSCISFFFLDVKVSLNDGIIETAFYTKAIGNHQNHLSYHRLHNRPFHSALPSLQRAFFSRDEGMVNADFVLNSVAGKESNTWILNWMYPKILITAYISLAFFFLLRKPLSYTLYYLLLLQFLPHIQGLYFRLACATFIISICCATVCVLRLIGLNQTEKIGVRYSIFEVPGDIRTTESTHCISLNNKNIYEI